MLIFFWRNNEARELFLSHQHALHDSFRNKCLFFSEEIRRHAGFWLNNQSLIISSEEQAFFFWRNDEACCHLSGQHMPHHFYCVKWLCFLEKSMKHAGACGVWYMSMLPNLKNPPSLLPQAVQQASSSPAPYYPPVDSIELELWLQDLPAGLFKPDHFHPFRYYTTPASSSPLQ